MTGVSCLVVMKTPSDNRHLTPSVDRATLALLRGPAIASRPRLRDRLLARWRARRLDGQLAAGVPAEASPALALRARKLIDVSRRRSIADGLRRIVRDAQEGVRPALGRVNPPRRRVAAASHELTVLADALAEPGPVAPPGVARAWILLTDGAGPLYNPGSEVSLQAELAAAVAQLQP